MYSKKCIRILLISILFILDIIKAYSLDREFDGLYGKVHTVILHYYSAQEKHVNTYDEKGNKIKWVLLDSNDEVIGVNTYKFNDENQIIEQSSCDVFGTTISNEVYSYSINDNLEFKILYSNSEIETIVKYIEREDGKLLWEIHYKNDETVDYKWLYKYEKNGYLYEVVKYNSKNEILNIFKYIYNDKFEIVEKIMYSHNKDILYRYEYLYDEHGRVISDLKYDGDGSLIVGFYNKYDEHNDRIEWVKINPDFSIAVKIEEQYDEFHNVISELIYTDNSDNVIIRKYKYLYDTFNNWIIKYQYEIDYPDKIVEVGSRQIKYY